MIKGRKGHIATQKAVDQTKRNVKRQLNVKAAPKYVLLFYFQGFIIFKGFFETKTFWTF